MRRVSLLLFCCTLISPAHGLATPSADLSGRVTDVDGAALTGVTVTLMRLDDGTTRTALTDERGRYRFTELDDGRYRVEAVLSGFQRHVRTVEIGSGEDVSLEQVLQLRPETAAEVTVTARREIELENVPGSVAVIGEQAIGRTRAQNLQDVLEFTPGVLVQSRFGADESQLSIRGSGLRNNFHARGVNLLVNGIPYQDADGASDFESLDLMATDSVQVWKGANALRYGGNSMGGAINLSTPTGHTAAPLQLRAQGGAFDLFKAQVSAGGVKGTFDWWISASDTELGGYREHSDQGRQRLFANLGWDASDQTEVRFDVVYANVAETLPGALTREGMARDPRQADPNNVTQDWGRFYNYVRLATRVNHRIAPNQELWFTAHGQYRSMVHPIFQILDNDNRNAGADVRYRITGKLFGRGDRLVVGFTPQYGDVTERRFANVAGDQGDLVALFGTAAENYGFYFENELDLSEELILVTGGRFDWAGREFEDRVLSDGDRSDDRGFSAFTPKVGLVWRPGPDVEVFGNVSRSYEPPLLLELTSFGAAGFLDLEAQDTWQFEIGTRGTWADRLSWDVALFDDEIDDEIININVQPFPFAPFTIPSFRNADQTRHLGLEAGGTLHLLEGLGPVEGNLSWRNSYTWSSFEYVDDPTFGDNDLPGAPRHLLRSEVRYDDPRGFWVGPAVSWSPASYFVDSANTAVNDAYTVLDLRGGFDVAGAAVFFELANVTDEIYSGSVQVDSADGRFFEPSNGRSAYLGLRWEY